MKITKRQLRRIIKEEIKEGNRSLAKNDSAKSVNEIENNTIPSNPDAAELSAKISMLLGQYQYLPREEMQQAANSAIELFFPQRS